MRWKVDDRDRRVPARRRDEPAARTRRARIAPPGSAPVLDDPIELAPERVCVRTGRLLDRTAPARRTPGR
jgi:hypothetical protein